MIKPRFSQAELKLAAVVGMTLNHTAGILLANGTIREIMLLTGGISMPLFARFISDGFEYTKDRGKYVFRLGVSAVISHFAFSFAFGTPYLVSSAVFTLLLAFFALCTIHMDNVPSSIRGLMLFCILICSLIGDWGWCAILWTILFDLLKNCPKRRFLMITAFVLIGVAYAIFMFGLTGTIAIRNFGFLLAIPLLLAYSGKQGRQPKALRSCLYLYYPAHLFVLGIIKDVIV